MIRVVIVCLLLAGCDSDPPRKYSYGDGGAGALRAVGVMGVHVASCDAPTCGNGANPPLGGDHCGSTLPCRRYDTVQPRCSWIHNLEHGHVVLAYNCPAGCPELVSKLNTVWEERQSSSTKKRILVTPDSKLPFRMAALVWGFGCQSHALIIAHADPVSPQRRPGRAPSPAPSAGGSQVGP